jgi:hypothetical protein
VYPDISANQSETSIAVNPLNENNLLIGANTPILNHPYGGSMGFYYSVNGGNNWSGSDTLPTNSLNQFLGDPAVAFNLYGEAFYAFIHGTSSSSPWGLNVLKSSDGGSTWYAEVSIPNVGDADKPHMTIDNNPSSPYQNYIYVAWTDFSGSGPYRIKFSRSTNRGSSFS